MRVDDPGVADLGGALDRPVAVGGDPDRGVSSLDRAEHAPHSEEPAVRRLKRHRVTAPELLDNMQVPEETLNPLVRRHSECLLLDVAVPQADAENESAAGHDVEAGRFLRDGHRV